MGYPVRETDASANETSARIVISVKRLKSDAWDRAIAWRKRLCRLRRVSVINFTNIQSAFLECSRSLCRPRNASLDGLKARKRIGPRVNEVLTINDGAAGPNVFLVGRFYSPLFVYIATRELLYILYYLYDAKLAAYNRVTFCRLCWTNT